MKLRQAVFGLIALVVAAIAFGVGRYFRPNPLVNHAFTIYVHSDPTTGSCQASSPIQNLSYNTDQVQWEDDDQNQHKYWVDFTNITPPPIPPDPITHQPYVPESPLAHNEDHVLFSPGHPTGLFHVKPKEKYYYYAIFDQSNPSQPCKAALDDRDTGLHVKR